MVSWEHKEYMIMTILNTLSELCTAHRNNEEKYAIALVALKAALEVADGEEFMDSLSSAEHSLLPETNDEGDPFEENEKTREACKILILQRVV